MTSLIGEKVVVVANDFVQKDLDAAIIEADTKNKKVLLRLEHPLINGNVKYQHAVASVRLARDDFDTLADVGVLGCSVTWVPEGKFSQKDPFSLSWWRGGAAAITDLRLA